MKGNGEWGTPKGTYGMWLTRRQKQWELVSVSVLVKKTNTNWSMPPPLSLSLSLLWVVPFSYSLPSACPHPIPSKITISSRESQVMCCAHSSLLPPHLPFLFFLNCSGSQPNKLLNRGFSQYSCSCVKCWWFEVWILEDCANYL